MNRPRNTDDSGTITLDGVPSRPISLADERRCGPRIGAGIGALLRSLEGDEVLACAADDFGEGGLRIHAPIDLGFAVGQRYQVVITDVPDGAELPDLRGEEQYATVLRTESREDAPDAHVGVGLRFDQPIFL